LLPLIPYSTISITVLKDSEIELAILTDADIEDVICVLLLNLILPFTFDTVTISFGSLVPIVVVIKLSP